MTTYSLVFSIDGCLYKEGRQQGGVHICKHQSIYGAARSISVKGDLVGGWVGGGGQWPREGVHAEITQTRTCKRQSIVVQAIIHQHNPFLVTLS